MENAARGRGGWYCGVGAVVSVTADVVVGFVEGWTFLPDDGGEVTPDLGLSVI